MDRRTFLGATVSAPLVLACHGRDHRAAVVAQQPLDLLRAFATADPVEPAGAFQPLRQPAR